MADISPDFDNCLAVVRLYAAAAVVPMLTDSDPDGDIQHAIRNNQRATIWAPNTAYHVGDVVVPPLRNGHRYRCVSPGTSDQSGNLYYFWPTAPGDLMYGSATNPPVCWEECGPDWFNLPGDTGPRSANVYDARAAIYDCWVLKAQRASVLMNQKADNVSFDFAQIREHCLAEAEKFKPEFTRPAMVVRS
jgi:hypothetical protein